MAVMVPSLKRSDLPDEDDDTQNPPVDDKCIVGQTCKSMTSVTIPADIPKQPLALIQAEVLIGQLLDRFTNIALDTSGSDLTPELSYQFRVPTAVYITYDHR